MIERLSYVIVGNGIAGVTAAETLRAADAAADITIITGDPSPIYSRPALKDYLAGRLQKEKLWARPAGFYQDNHIRLLLEQVTKIHVNRHSVELQSGREVSYDRLLLAAGARARRLSCPGADLAGVVTLRTIADYQAVLNHLGAVRRVVVCGSGPLALEVGEILQHRGYQVIHLLRHRRLWPGVLDQTASDLVLRQEWRDGVEVHVEEEIVSVAGKNGQVLGVVSSRGAHIPCELVVTAIGVEPVIDFIQASGIACARGVRIDGLMRTNAPDVYAAGDVAEMVDMTTGQTRVTGQWYPAMQQGRAAAYSMLGVLNTQRPFRANSLTGRNTTSFRTLTLKPLAEEKVAGVETSWGYQAYLHYIHASFLYGLDFAAVGLTTPPVGGKGYEELVNDPHSSTYRKVLLKNGVAVGMLTLGDRKDALAYKRAIDHGVNLAPVASRLFDADFKLSDWLDRLRVPTPILAVSRDPIDRARSAAQRDAYVLPIVSASRGRFIAPNASAQRSEVRVNLSARSVNHNEAVLVPVLPASPTPCYIVPKWAETQLSSTATITIGRDVSAALVINHNSVSRRHAEITCVNGQYYLRDLGSKNGTFLNDMPLQARAGYPLKPGDRVRIGTVIVYMFQVRAAEKEAELAYASRE